MHDLPIEILRQIYDYDTTYSIFYKTCIDEMHAHFNKYKVIMDMRIKIFNYSVCVQFLKTACSPVCISFSDYIFQRFHLYGHLADANTVTNGFIFNKTKHYPHLYHNALL